MILPNEKLVKGEKKLGIKDFFSIKNKVCAVQTAREPDGYLGGLARYTPIAPAEYGLYATMREAVPIIDAALDKIVRLTGDFEVVCTRRENQRELESFIQNIRVGTGSYGMHQFVAAYLNSLLTYGNAVGEVVLESDGCNVAALYNAKLSDVCICAGKSPLDVKIGTTDMAMGFTPVKYPELVMFTALNPPPGSVTGVSLLRSLPFVTSILMEIYSSINTNFRRIANLRYAVTYKPGSSRLDKAYAKDIAETIAKEWSSAMDSAATGNIKDFVAVGDMDIKVIGADNQMINTEIPVRQMLEQIVAKLGIPPFMLGLHWSTTERMSTQQADILTSELESYRRVLDSVIVKICDIWLKVKGYTGTVNVLWNDINLQDELETAKARLIGAQADEITSGMGEKKGE